MKPAHPVHGADMPAPVGNESTKTRIWRAMVEGGCSQREAAKKARCSRWIVRNEIEKWVAMGWLVKLRRGGVRPTEKAPKNLREGWAATPQGSPLEPHAPFVRGIGTASRLHRRKLMAELGRCVDPVRLQYWERSKPNHLGVIYHKFVVPCKTASGLVGVPIQIIQPKEIGQPFGLIIQSVNLMARESEIVGLGVEGTLLWVREAMDHLVRSWLRDDAGHLGPLRWLGDGKEEMEVAQEAQPGAPRGGDPQRDFVAVDDSEEYTPFNGEEEQKLSAFVRLRRTENTVQRLEEGQDRLTALLERLAEASTEQIDQIAAIAEHLAKQRKQ